MTNLPTLVNGYIPHRQIAQQSYLKKRAGCVKDGSPVKTFHQRQLASITHRYNKCFLFLIDRSFIGDQRQLGGRQFRFAAPTIVVDIHLIAPVNWCWHGENLGSVPRRDIHIQCTTVFQHGVTVPGVFAIGRDNMEIEIGIVRIPRENQP